MLSKHLKLLADAGYLDVIKRAENGRQRTWIALNKDGRRAYQNHVRELKRIVGQSGTTAVKLISSSCCGNASRAAVRDFTCHLATCRCLSIRHIVMLGAQLAIWGDVTTRTRT